MQKYTKEWLSELCASSYSYAEVLRKAGRKGGGSQQTLKKKIKEWDIDISHFTGQRWQASPNQKRQVCKEAYSLDEVFCKNSPITQRGLRGYVRRYNIIEYKCVESIDQLPKSE